ncbi:MULTISPECIES: hypothetical protein [unclassified Paraburkholderia]|uniref:hypothetical protein n=1 Tax=unclassified Paraburkholderia TaxID=2615204 RepID=UPI00161AA285|nr:MULTISPECIES: hypothetical protein [unclassified Paraburkholderia]MBB5448438.1 hypothetical protein [Paraburkholderia sp. WSM4177]MBB5488819.1 hypothetical protein [Paraburkholderia sp. WSM4180]
MLFGDAPAFDVIEVNYANSVDRVAYPVVDDCTMHAVRDGRRQRRQMPNSSPGRRGRPPDLQQK